jgi:molybdate transport system regulatory protein
MIISARNQIKGRVTDIQTGKAMAFVTIQAGEMQLASLITTDAVHELKLKQNDQVTAIVKASDVMLAKGALSQLSGRNRLAGQVDSVHQDEAMSFVTVIIGRERLGAAISTQAVTEMGLKQGDQVIAIIKATGVMLAK